MNEIYRCIKDLNVSQDYYGHTVGSGTIRRGSLWKLVRNPDPKKKLYKLEEIPQKNYKPANLYLRKQVFEEYFEQEEVIQC